MVSNATSEGATEVGDVSTASAADGNRDAGSSDQQPRSKKAKTGGAPGEDPQMDMDDEAGGHTEPEDEVDEEDDEEDEANQDDEEGDEEDEDEDVNEDIMQDAMEERDNAGEDDEALDNGDDSDA